MAEQDENATEDEAQALERLLDEEAEKEEEEASEEEGGKSKKKLFIIAGGAVLLIGGVVGFLMMGAEEEVPPTLEELAKPLEEPEITEEKKQAIREAEAPKFYKLEPFFLPLKENKKETGQFVHVGIHLQMSNIKLNEEIDNVLPLIRQTIYEILERKRPRDFSNPKKPIKERLKSEIVTSTNTLLVTGSGKINDVYFSEFIIR